MAIQFARIEIVGRSKGGNACCKGAYNARGQIKDEKTGVTYNFSNKGDNVYHTVLLPEGVDEMFKDIKYLMNAVEEVEKQKNSQLLKDIVIALPDDKELTLQDRINITHEIIEEMAWVKNGLAVQIDIHEPHDGEKNWHAHLLVTTRRFTECGKFLFPTKARDLNPTFKTGNGKNFIIPEEDIIHEKGKRVINNYFKKLGLENRVDEISTVPGEHIGPVRMRSILNGAAERNELRAIAHLENMKDGDSVIDRVTRTQSVFSRKDLERAVKDVPNLEERYRLMSEALASDRVVTLSSSVLGEFMTTELFTTREVRAEEMRIMRIAEEINARDNFSRSPAMAQGVINRTGISEAQGAALEKILLGEGGIRVLRGRAGTGKSHVLGIANKLARQQGINVIGLAPTNKAKNELQAKGFKEAFTVKGYLFALNSGRVILPKESLIILDEAGMVANSDLQELVKVASRRKANLVLAGDERQLTSVERGGLFEVMAKKFGGYELSEIRRQSSVWGREMASCFASGDTTSGIRRLEENGGIKEASSLEDSMSRLIAAWQGSKFAIDEKLVITVRNKDVDALNDAIRETLKLSGVLKGKAYRIERKEKIGEHFVAVNREFMTGDRVMFAANNKAQGIANGEFGTILAVSSQEFVVKIDGDEGRVISFDPSRIDSLRYGYAVTTYKSQGASIKDVYNLHTGAGNARSTYVNLTRHTEKVSLFYNKQATKNIGHLIKQLEVIDEKCSSLNFVTDQEILDSKNKGELGALNKVSKWLKDKVAVIGDKLHQNPKYYQFEEAAIEKNRVEDALEAIYSQAEFVDEENVMFEQEEALGLKEIAVVNIGSSGSKAKVTSRQSAKVRFYDKADKVKGTRGADYQEKARYREVRDYKGELESLKQQIKFKAERIASNLLGERNKRLSNGNTYRYGEKGSLAVSVNGSKAGTWYDFEEGVGGDMISLVERETKQDFKGAIEYLKSIVGHSNQTTLRLVYDYEAGKRYTDSVAADSAEQVKQERRNQEVIQLYAKAKMITRKNIASKYLREERGVNCDPGIDIRTTGIWDKSTAKRYPAIIAFARNEAQEITGGQTISLDPDSAAKADINIAKKSFGKISGSFVEIQAKAQDQAAEQITFIAEGLETALSIKEAGVEGKILCSLGIGNIKNYQPRPGERVMLCADNDGADSKTMEVIEKARNFLEDSGAIVHISYPTEVGDFNDLLKAQGIEGVREKLEPAIEELNQDDGRVRTREKLLSIVTNTRETLRESRLESKNAEAKINPELVESFSRIVDDIEKYVPTNSYKIVKAYNEKGIEAAYEIGRKQVREVIVQKVSKTLEAFDTAAGKTNKANQPKLIDFKGQECATKLDYLSALGGDKEMISYIETSSLQPLIQEAVNKKKAIQIENEKDLEYVLSRSVHKFKEMGVFGVKVDIDKITETLRPLSEKERKAHVDLIWTEAFRGYVKQHKDIFDKDKAECKSMPEMLKILESERDFCSHTYKNYISAIVQSEKRVPTNYIGSNAITHNKNPDLLKDLEQHFHMSSTLGISNEQAVIEQIKSSENIYHVEKISTNLFNRCQDHIVKEISHDLVRLQNHEIIEKDNMQFTNHKDYLEHHVNNKVLSPYLQHTPIPQKLTDIYRHEEHAKQQQHHQEGELEIQKSRNLGRDHGMDI